jgi:hypothetical protein
MAVAITSFDVPRIRAASNDENVLGHRADDVAARLAAATAAREETS